MVGELQVGDGLRKISFEGKNFLESRNIKLVLTVAKDLPVKVPSLQIAHVVYEVEDRVTAEIARYFEPAARTIKEGLKRGGVLGKAESE